MYRNNDVEVEIDLIHKNINALLDLRFVSHDVKEVQRIDEELRGHTQRLFILEA